MMNEFEPMGNLTLTEEIAKAISKMHGTELGTVFNNFYVKTSIGTRIYSIGEFDEVFTGTEPLDIASMVKNSNFNSYLPFFYIDEHSNNLVSVGEIYADEEPIKDYFDELVSYVVYNNDPLDNFTLANVLDKYNTSLIQRW